MNCTMLLPLPNFLQSKLKEKGNLAKCWYASHSLLHFSPERNRPHLTRVEDLLLQSTTIYNLQSTTIYNNLLPLLPSPTIYITATYLLLPSYLYPLLYPLPITPITTHYPLPTNLPTIDYLLEVTECWM